MEICGNCRFFIGPRKLPDAEQPGGMRIAPARDLAGVYSKGTCRRFPQFVQHLPEETCGEWVPAPEIDERSN